MALGDVFYYRLQSPVVIAELDHHCGVFLDYASPKPFHIHTVMAHPAGQRLRSCLGSAVAVTAPARRAHPGQWRRSELVSANVKWFSSLGMKDLEDVGGKNSSLGEMIGNLASAGVRVPDGFATTASAFRDFVSQEGLSARITGLMEGLDTDDVDALSRVGKQVRQAIVDQPLQPELEEEIRDAYANLSEGDDEASFAVRSSATAEDLPDASFAGQQETFLNIRGIEGILQAIHEVFASLYNDRAIAYRVHHGFEHADVALSAGVQRMVRSDVGASGVMFTMDTESGFTDAVFVTASYGLGEAVVQGAVNPDEWYVWKPGLAAGTPAVLKRGVGGKATKMVFTEDPNVGKTTEFVDVDAAERVRFSLTDEEVEELARLAVSIEQHYGRPMDIEWGKDGVDGKLYILQARPETVQSRRSGASLQRYRVAGKAADREVLVEGRAIGQKAGAGAVRILKSADQMRDFHEGEVLVADMTDPDWEPIMKRASRDRHQPRWADLPRGDHRPRAGHPRGGRHGVGDARSSPTATR